MLQALIRDCLQAKPAQRPDFTAIKDRLARLVAAESSGQLESLEEDQDTVGSMDAGSFKRRVNPNNRLSIDTVRPFACFKGCRSGGLQTLSRCSMSRCEALDFEVRPCLPLIPDAKLLEVFGLP